MAEVLFPKTLDQTIEAMCQSKTPALLAGGTDLLVRLRNRSLAPATLVSLDKVEGMKEIRETEQEIRIRAGATLHQICTHEAIRAHAPVLEQAISAIGSPQIRNMGTLGGNIMTASPAGDSLPALYVLETSVDLAGPNGFRRMDLADFITGPGQTRTAPGEILWQIVFPKPAAGTCHWFEKVGQRTALSIAVVSMAALFSCYPDGMVSRIRLAWGSVGKTVITSPETEAFLTGKRLEPDVLTRAADLARTAVAPISDIRAGKNYRRQVAGNLLQRLDRVAHSWELPG